MPMPDLCQSSHTSGYRASVEACSPSCARLWQGSGRNSGVWAGKDPDAERSGIKSSPAHQHSHSADSLVKKLIHVSVGTAWAEVVWHAKISVNNCIPSQLPEPWWRDRMGEKTKEETPNKCLYRECIIEISFFTWNDSFNKLSIMVLGFGRSWRETPSLCRIQVLESNNWHLSKWGTLESMGCQETHRCSGWEFLIYPKCVWCKWEQFLQKHWLCLCLKRHTHTTSEAQV